MPTREDLFPSKYLKEVDLNGEAVPVEIEKAPTEKMRGIDGKEGPKTVLYFKGATKSLPLNMTNWDSCAEICGQDTLDWAGHWIELYPDKTTLPGGKVVGCIRIRPVTKRQPKKSALPPKKPVLPKNEPPQDDPDDPGFIPGKDDMDGDQIPF
jgi:hypothetical protein